MSSHAPSPPITSPSKKRFHADPEPRQGAYQDEPPNSNSEPYKDKITRELPNLSECHGCGLRIDYSNPKARLGQLDSFWRIVLLCKRCIKQVNSRQACLYCFKDSVSSVSDCFICADCERLVHKDCVRKYGNSPPWSYSCKRSELGFSVCIDCWVPDMLKKSARPCRKHKNENGVGGKGDSSDKSLEERVKDANCAVKNKIAVAAMAKEKALRKAVAAQNAIELASNVVNLAGKKDLNGDKSEGLVENSKNDVNSAADVTKDVDDTELAFRLHRAMNSSRRISKNTGSMNLRYLELDKMEGSNISGNWMDLGSHEDGMVAVSSHSKLSEDNDGSISEASANVGSKENGPGAVPGRLKYFMKTYKRQNLKRKGYAVNNMDGNLVSCTINDPSRIVAENHSPQNVNNAELQVNNAQGSCHEQCNAEVKEEGCGNSKSDRYFLKYRKKKAGSRCVIPTQASSCFVSSEKENQHFILGLPVHWSIEYSGLSDASLRSCIVNRQ